MYLAILFIFGWGIFIMTSGFPVPYPPNMKPSSQPDTVDHSPIVGFDCNQTEPEILSISTLEIAACPEIASLQPKTTSKFGQIIQRHILESIKIQTCQLTKSTSYFRCGRNWLNYNVYPPAIGIIITLPSKTCQEIHRTGNYEWAYGKNPWTHLAANTTYHFSANEVGWTDSTGYCEGGETIINGVAHKEIVVQSSYTLSIRESWGTVDYDSGTLNIERSLSCNYKEGSCQDSVSGTHTWSPNPQKCPEDKYKLIYQGQVNLTTSSDNPTVLLSVNSPPILFTSELGMTTYVCGLNMRMTEFPEIFFLEQSQGQYQVILEKPSNLDIKLITYLNAKLTFTYHNIMDSARSMYLSSLHQTCLVEREMLRNRIEIIRLNSAAGGLSSLLKEGMFAKTNGEVIHLIKCLPVPVQFRKTTSCYESLPITYKGLPVFLLPNTHIITPYSPTIDCSPITPLTYRIGNEWWSYTGQFQRSISPVILEPKSKTLPKFSKIRSFSQGGMYSQEQVEAVQKLLTFPALRESITTDLVDGMTHFSNRRIALDITSVMSEADWETVAKRNLLEAWGYFSSVGSAISGFIGIYFLYRLIKGALTMIIDGHDLYKIFGCSLYLLSSVWSRLALYFIHKSNENPRRRQQPEDNNETLSLQSLNPPTAPLMETETHQVRTHYVPIYPPQPSTAEKSDESSV